MKKGILAAVLLAMIGWTLYETVFTGDSATEENTLTEGNNGTEENAHTEEDYEVQDEIVEPPEEEVGLSQGDYAPDFELDMLDGSTAKLSDFRGEKIMLNFWATWCPPCRAEMPDMQEVYEENDVLILAVNLTQTETGMNAVESFVDDFGLTFPIMLDEDIEVADLYEIQPIPTSFMINSEGRIHNIAYGPMNKDMIVQQFTEMD
ncbi:redoxin family protein [Evansella sp. LMS18]|uniref:redoxin domain-containing protein n=1 Tax=Evansella sp. LMS18 TaxID=2924033 RepID=UPI0020D1CCD9|nr:redoxin domain-containing protein [Evansella sp. LMS18]UTR11560.1 redoxin family protein [Evansella sp. LMS18]